MRTPRIIILSAFTLAFVTLLFLSSRTPQSHPSINTSTYSPITPTSSPHKPIFPFTFTFSAPLSLFPPNAIISLTDDNTTAFHARPAAFGPGLPKHGMSGQLWIGSGFGDERLGLGLGNAGAELGCSDLPGWGGSELAANRKVERGNGRKVGEGEGGRKGEGERKHSKRVLPAEDAMGGLSAGIGGGKGDGTDDWLHPAIAPGVDMAGALGKNRILDPSASHADIQSLQESAEISGKVVLLQRGGCGFLEKVLWAQRRGGIAVIVGDDVPNRPLIQMYARGDTSNVTVPSVFTSRNTARMLSSLYGEGMDGGGGGGGAGAGGEHKRPKHHEVNQPPKTPKNPKPTERGTSWLGRHLSGGASDAVAEIDISSLDISDRFGGSASAKAVKNSPSASKPKSGNKQDDGFVIGVQDWRDPDLVNKPADEIPFPFAGTGVKKAAAKGQVVKEKEKERAFPDADAVVGKRPNLRRVKGKAVVVNPPDGAGAVVVHADMRSDLPPRLKGKSKGKGKTKVGGNGDGMGFLNRVFGDDRDVSSATLKSGGDETDEDGDGEGDDHTAPPPLPPVHEGVWVTLTQTNGATPFFDTLLVLVVSPLVTLTVVYAMLLIRSRIRRRRWRAPKSVVQQLPVRTFVARDARQDSNASQASQAGRSTSPLGGGAGGVTGGEATPLLTRPRSHTTSGLPEPGISISRSNSSSALLDEPKAVDQRQSGGVKKVDKGASHGSQWKKYMGRQVECVVCLEEYVDGVSRVMSLPCGHEFHVECITPWLTTRRRTCPICKGDVVRSLQRANGSTSPRYTPYEEDEEDEERQERQERVAGMGNESPSAGRPISVNSNEDEDVEQGVASPRSRSRDGRGGSERGWLQTFAERLGFSSAITQLGGDRRRD